MPKPRPPLFAGELMPESRGPGRPTDATTSVKTRAGQALQLVAVKKVIVRMLNGESRTAAISRVSSEVGRSVRTVEELFLSNVRDALPEVLAEMRLAGRDSSVDTKAVQILRNLDQRQARQRKTLRR